MSDEKNNIIAGQVDEERCTSAQLMAGEVPGANDASAASVQPVANAQHDDAAHVAAGDVPIMTDQPLRPIPLNAPTAGNQTVRPVPLPHTHDVDAAVGAHAAPTQPQPMPVQPLPGERPLTPVPRHASAQTQAPPDQAQADQLPAGQIPPAPRMTAEERARLEEINGVPAPPLDWTPEDEYGDDQPRPVNQPSGYREPISASWEAEDIPRVFKVCWLIMGMLFGFLSLLAAFFFTVSSSRVTRATAFRYCLYGLLIGIVLEMVLFGAFREQYLQMLTQYGLVSGSGGGGTPGGIF